MISLVATSNNYLSLNDFIDEYLQLRKKGKNENGKYLQTYINERAVLVNEISFDDPERFEKISYVLKNTRRTEILSSAIKKIKYQDPEECIKAFNILSPKKSNSKERNELIEKVRKDFIIKMIDINKNIIESSNNICEQLGKFQRCLSYVLGRNISDGLFEEVIMERKFPTVESFKVFYEKLLGNEIYPKGTTEKKRAFVIQQYLLYIPDRDFAKQALSFAFKTENSNIMLLRIKKVAENRKIELAIPNTCFNLRASFTQEEINLVEEEMNTTKKENGI